MSRKNASQKKKKRNRYTINDIKKIARSRGGKCLSEEYINAHTKLLWQCEYGHQWMTAPMHILKGMWCPKCNCAERLTIAKMHEIASSRDGKCLSTEYVKSSRKLLWECKHGHQWEAIPNAIRNGRWCPYCGGTMRGNIEEMHKIAADKSGLCLSKEYKNNKTKLLWQCAEKHQWYATADQIKRGA